MAQILVNHDNPFLAPTKRQRPFAERVLASSTFGIFENLLMGTLSYIQLCQATEMMSSDLLSQRSDPPSGEP